MPYQAAEPVVEEIAHDLRLEIDQRKSEYTPKDRDGYVYRTDNEDVREQFPIGRRRRCLARKDVEDIAQIQWRRKLSGLYEYSRHKRGGEQPPVSHRCPPIGAKNRPCAGHPFGAVFDHRVILAHDTTIGYSHPLNILGIETSCDETAVCLIEATGEFGTNFRFNVLGNALYSQAKLHEQYGGVFPSLAKREHARNLVPLLQEALRQSGALAQYQGFPSVLLQDIGTMLAREPELFEQLSVFFGTHGKPNIDCIAVTHGPGLEPCLWVGVNFAKALSLAWNVPIVAVDHMEGHIILSMMKDDGLAEAEFPLLALLISGGHTELVVSKEFHEYEVVGKTRDDAAGEAFDKVARLLGLPYPGGPEISKLAKEARGTLKGAPLVRLPRPMLREDNLDFSFAGLKTAVRKLVEKQIEQGLPLLKSEIAMEFENAVADVLVGKTLRAIDQFGANTIVVGGGVSANSYIRERLARALEDEGDPAKLLVPPPALATDNALMIALAGYFRALENEFTESENLVANGNLKLC